MSSTLRRARVPSRAVGASERAAGSKDKRHAELDHKMRTYTASPAELLELFWINNP